jgi:hypothetical protein
MSTAPFCAIFNSSVCVGHIIKRGPRGFESFDGSDRPLGIFDNERDALEAICPST